MYVFDMQFSFFFLGNRNMIYRQHASEGGNKEISRRIKRKTETPRVVTRPLKRTSTCCRKRCTYPKGDISDQTNNEPKMNIRNEGLQNNPSVTLHENHKYITHTVIGSSAERVWACLYLVLNYERSTLISNQTKEPIWNTHVFAPPALECIRLGLRLTSAQSVVHVQLVDLVVLLLSFFRGHFLHMPPASISFDHHPVKNRRTSLLILQNLSTRISPLTTPARRLGFFLSLRLMNNLRIFWLYSFETPSNSLNTLYSIASARFRICSVASRRSKKLVKCHPNESLFHSRAPESLAIASYNNSIHLSRALSPLDSILTASDLTVRGVSDWDTDGVEGAGVEVEGVAVAVDIFRGGGGSSLGSVGVGGCGEEVLDFAVASTEACFLTTYEK